MAVGLGAAPAHADVDPICATGVVDCPSQVPYSNWDPRAITPEPGDPWWNRPYKMPGTNALKGLIA
ncbi:hypothetical protein [Nocardia tengchongensis]|uniref:hypothetical protein n=1 Tax=Nocardia tengchongensis TaxID=2055889 RepID=UPI0036B9AAFC